MGAFPPPPLSEKNGPDQKSYLKLLGVLKTNSGYTTEP